jgi:RNA polymerase sigma-70 factor (ECF subfamily)
MDDTELIAQIQGGNTECANKLIERYYASILRYCSWHCPDSNRAEDLTQETFFRVFRNIRSYNSRGKFKSYLYTIAHRLCIDEYRKQSFYTLDEDVPAFDAGIKKIEDQEQLAHFLNLLSQPQREAVILRYGEQLSFKEIAQITDVPTRTVQSRVRLALAIMRKEKS